MARPGGTAAMPSTDLSSRVDILGQRIVQLRTVFLSQIKLVSYPIERELNCTDVLGLLASRIVDQRDYGFLRHGESLPESRLGRCAPYAPTRHIANQHSNNDTHGPSAGRSTACRHGNGRRRPTAFNRQLYCPIRNRVVADPPTFAALPTAVQ
jgi:hypothetical protein